MDRYPARAVAPNACKARLSQGTHWEPRTGASGGGLGGIEQVDAGRGVPSIAGCSSMLPFSADRAQQRTAVGRLY